MTDAETEVIDKACAWRRAQKARLATPEEKKEAARKVEFNAQRKLWNAVDLLEKQRQVQRER